jgi:hypothetical protein
MRTGPGAQTFSDPCRVTGSSSVSPWSTKQQPTVSRPSAEAKYRAVANAATECIWPRQLLSELHCSVDGATVAFYDNVSAVFSNPVHHRRTKHIEINIHFVRERRASCSPYADCTAVRGCHDEGAAVFYIHELTVQSMHRGGVNASLLSCSDPFCATASTAARHLLRTTHAPALPVTSHASYNVESTVVHVFIYMWRSIQSMLVGSFSLPS